MKYDYVFGYSKRIFTHSSQAGRVGNAFHVHLKMTVFSFPPFPTRTHPYTDILSVLGAPSLPLPILPAGGPDPLCVLC